MATTDDGKVDKGEDKDAGEADTLGDDDWEDLMEGKIRKRTVKDGYGESPEINQDVSCTVEIRSQDSDELLQCWSQMRYRLGESEAFPALELTLRHMRPLEVCEVTSISRFAFGPDGCLPLSDEKEVPPDTDVRLRVTLHDIFPVAPADRNKQEWVSRVQELEWRKNNGNDHFRRKKLALAARCYAKGMEVFPEAPIRAPLSLGRSAGVAAAQTTKTLADLISNLSAVNLEQGNVRDALENAKISVDLCPEHPKALYRAARACLELGEFEECDRFLVKLTPMQPEDAGIKRLVADLAKARNKHAAKCKKLGAALLEAAGENRPDYDKKDGEQESDLGGPIQEFAKAVLPSKQMLAILCGLICLSVLAIFLSPRAYRHYAIIGSILGSVSIFAISSVFLDPDLEGELAAKKARAEKSKEMEARRAAAAKKFS
eukprot:TRINITY_DN31025_c0_g2_i1.p1 TRINITY_DN31025_c0_g2~~TRINITY_DN31025_c0_g2_i1.p1  ORF type:complete len:431 (-),score=97.29 TRINITY_DN31025_c0_g2_i1:82-1374(-)